MIKKHLLWIAALALVAGCTDDGAETTAPEAAVAPTETPAEFAERANTEYRAWWRELNAAGWLRATYINIDSGIVDALANERYAAWHSNIVKQALRYDGADMAPEIERQIDLFKMGALLVAPDDDAKRKEQATILTDLKGAYGSSTYCRTEDDCLGISALESKMQQGRDYDELLDYWVGWRSVAPPMRENYRRFVELANEGANEFGYGDMGEMWRSHYDMDAADFEAETARLWEQVEPLYKELHCHVRARLGEVYGEDKVPQDGMIPAHLLGNMWAQQWSSIYDLLEPYPGVSDLDVDSTLKTKNYSPQEMVRSAENFYVSLGLQRLPQSFWERSQFSKPADREVVCHASAWDLDGEDDLRIKMCIKQTYDELRTIYHELGHNYYQWAYKKQPMIMRDGAHGGFHEAIGDTVVLSMTPEYLAEVGLVESAEQSEQAIINRQMQQALDRIAFLPFGKLIDEWRWGVFSGAIAPEDYNKAWWELRGKYQGVAAPVERTEADFDPGAKYHVPANVSYTRYFLAHVLMFQFHSALCAAAGYDGDLYACSIFGSKEAGTKLQAMLEAGASEPWQNTLEKLTGTRQMDASAIIEYFQPLMGYLEEQNAGRTCGW